VATRKEGDIAHSADPGPLDVRLLGPLEVRHEGRLLKLGGAKPRTLLAALVLHLGEAVSVDRLIDDLWGESPPDSAPHAVEVHVSRLRKELGGALVTRAPGYVLAVEPDQVDLTRFARLVADGRALSERDPESAAAIFRDALALWRGPALADFAFEPFAQVEIGRLEELRSDALELRIDCDLRLGRRDLVAELQALVAASPLRERAREQLMLALYREGRQADALAEYRAARSALMEGLGVEPNPSLRALEAAILRQDAALTLPVRPAAQAQRKLATILFADLADSTGLAMSLDPETWRGVQRRYFEAVSAAVARHGGTTEKFVGDAVMAVFGTPIAHEDDALRAARAAVEARDAVAGLGEALERELGIELEVRVGLATGEVLSGGPAGDPLATGPAVNVAARLQQEVAPGEIAVDELTRRLTIGAGTFGALGALELRGLRRPVSAFRLEALASGAAAMPRRLDAPLVGRSPELGLLNEALARVLSEKALCAVTVSGPAGIGKSRLMRELIDGAADAATVMHGRCLSYGESATYRPLRDALVSPDAVAAVLEGEPDAGAIAAGLEVVFDTGATVPADEVPWAFRRYCETLAARGPLVLALDDLHWADPGLLDLVEHLAASARDVPILLLCVTREELGEERARFPAETEPLVLEPLSDAETDTLVDHLLPDSVLDDDTRAGLVAAAEGNPLFLEQLVAHVRETGLLEPPPTLRALLAARLDRLGPGERGVLERGAVVGREFAPDTVIELLDAAASPTVGAHLEALVRRGFLRPAPTGFRFRHGLIHDAVYRGASKDLRAALHEQVADVLDRAQADDEDIGYHLERAYHLRADLGLSDRHSRRLAEDAGRRLGAAGIRAWKRGEARGASRLLERASALLPLAHEERRELLCELGIALNGSGETARSAEVLEEAIASADKAGDRRVGLRARIEHAALRLLDDPRGAAARLLELRSEALPVFEGIGDDRSLGRTWMLTGWVHGGTYGRHAQWEEDATRALDHYHRAGWPPATCVGHIAAAVYGGPTPAPLGIARCVELLRSEVEDRASEANVLAHLGGLKAMLGQFDEGRELLAKSRTGYLDLGRLPPVLLTCAPIEAAIARLEGKSEDAASILRGSCIALKEEHRRFHLATQAAELADVLATLGQDDEAAEWCAVAEDCASSDDVSAQVWSRISRARLLTHAAKLGEAERIAEEALSLAETTDALNLRATVHLAVADLRQAAGDAEEAEAQLAAAERIFDEKGNVAAVARLRTERTAATAR
jgi:class 3 adenylate cyclase/tetratricopeptide (TPR) repeat protein